MPGTDFHKSSVDEKAKTSQVGEKGESINETVWDYLHTFSASLSYIAEQFSLSLFLLYSPISSVFMNIYNVFQNFCMFLFQAAQYFFFAQLSLIALPTLYGLLMVIFSWILVYYDSKIPGVYPPTPVSPKKHRYCS